MKKILMFSGVLIAVQSISAADSDTQLRLTQELKQQQYQLEQQLLKDEDIGQKQHISTIRLTDQQILTQKSPQQVAQALYMAVMQKDWQNVVLYLSQYKKIANHDLALIEFAEGSLARAQGDLKKAEQKFKNTLEIQSSNLIAKLELARVLFELQKNRESLEQFEDVEHIIIADISQTIPKEILKTVDTFTQALEQRDAWQGSVSFGGLYTTNINNSAEYIRTQTGYVIDENTGKLIELEFTQKSPDPIKTTGLDYEMTLGKRWSKSGNHGLAFRAINYGQWYEQQADYNELTLNFNAGYSYQDQKNQILIAPVFEYKWYGHDPLYKAYGLRTEWMNVISSTVAAKVDVEVKDLKYNKYNDQNGIEGSIFATFWKILPQQWTIFGGFDYVDHNTEEEYMSAYQQEGVRLGISRNFDSDFNATLFSAVRWRQFDKYAAVLGAKRDDFEQNYNIILSAPKWQFYGLIPTLNYRYNHNRSNVDWLYSYDKHNISLKLEHRF